MKKIIPLIFIIVVALLPFSKTLVPEWKVKVVDKSGEIIPNAALKQHWENYSFPYQRDEENLCSDSSGNVVFPKRTILTTPLIEFISFLLDLNPLKIINPHSSSGVSSSVLIGGQSIQANLKEDEEILPQTFVIDREYALDSGNDSQNSCNK